MAFTFVGWPQGHVVSFKNILDLLLMKRPQGCGHNSMEFSLLITDATCQFVLEVQVTTLETIKLYIYDETQRIPWMLDSM